MIFDIWYLIFDICYLKHASMGGSRLQSHLEIALLKAMCASSSILVDGRLICIFDQILLILELKFASIFINSHIGTLETAIWGVQFNFIRQICITNFWQQCEFHIIKDCNSTKLPWHPNIKFSFFLLLLFLLSFCQDITLIKCKKNLKSQGSLFVSKF